MYIMGYDPGGFMKLFFNIFCLVILIIPGCSGKPPPLQPAHIRIEDGEWLQYKGYNNGEFDYDLTLVTRYEKHPVWGDVIKTYEFVKSKMMKIEMPKNYSNFQNFYLISKSLASSVEMNRNFMEMTNSSDNGPVLMKYSYNDDLKEMQYKLINWNGKETTAQMNRIKIKQGYPFWDLTSIIFIGMRFMDITHPGICYVIAPFVFKDPMPGMIQILGKEEIEVPAGKFKTIKVGFKIADSFIGRLMDSYIKDTVIWLEDNESMRLIKMNAPLGGNMILQYISNVLK